MRACVCAFVCVCELDQKRLALIDLMTMIIWWFAIFSLFHCRSEMDDDSDSDGKY